MSTRSTSRSGTGAATLLALALPGILLASGLALSLQSSSARRFSAGAWATYLAGEIAEGAVAEAAHLLRVTDIFDPAVFGAAPKPEAFAAGLLGRMMNDQTPLKPESNLLPNLPMDLREYRAVKRGNEVARQMMVAFRFPARSVKVAVPGLARKIAARNPGVRLGADDLVVSMMPIAFRREYYRETQIRYADPSPRGGMRETAGPGRLWVSWGVVRFIVRARVEDLRGASTHELQVDRRFAIRSDVQPGEDALKISSLNLRASLRQVD